MAIFDFLRKRDEGSTGNVAATSNGTSTQVDDVLLQALIKGEPITRENAMTIPAVSSAVDFISGAIASMPVKLYKRKGRMVESIDDDPRVRLLNTDTGDTLNAYMLKKNLVQDYLMGRGGYAYIRKNRNDVTGLFYVDDSYVTVLVNANPIFKERKLFVYEDEYDLFEFIKLLRNSKDGASGVGLTTEVGKALETAYTTLLYQLGLVKTGGNKKGFLKSQRKLGQEEINALKNAWLRMYGNNSTENVVVLNNGLEFQEASNSSVEMQLDQNKKTLTNEIDDIFHIDQNNEYKTFKEAIYPIVRALTVELNSTLLLEKEKKNHFFEFDVKEIVRTSYKERFESYKLAKETGFMTINEIRRAENMSPIEGMDVINVGLGASLYDTNTHTYYTPNTGATADLQGVEKKFTEDAIYDQAKASGNIASLEQRYNPNHDSKTGKFAPGHGAGKSGGSGSGGNGGGSEGSGEKSGSGSSGGSSDSKGKSEGGSSAGGSSSDKEISEKVKAETEKVKSRLSNEAKPIEKQATDLKEVKDRGGLNDADAQKCASIAENIYAKAAAKEPQITSDVISSAEGAGAQMYGLDFRMKQPTSMAGKIGADSKENMTTFDEAGADIKDAIRYTAVLDDKNFTSGYNQIRKSMEDKGYTEVRCKNFYDMYAKGESAQKAVQSVYKDKDGQYFEFQFHTPTSQGAKELNHPLYEEQRKNTTTPKKWKELNDQMTLIGKNVPDPDGVMSIKSHK